MNNDIVFVVEDPVEWKTTQLINGIDPKNQSQKSPAPYYTDRDNATFNADECRAIEELGAETGSLLVKYEQPDGNIVYYKIDDLEATSCGQLFTDSDNLCHALLESFVQNIGGHDIRIEFDTEDERTDASTSKTNVNVGIDVPKASTSGNWSSLSTDNAQNHSQKRYASYTEHASANFKKAERLLKVHRWMDTPLLVNLLEKAQRKELHGKYTHTIEVDVFGTFIKTYKAALEIAGKYEVISGKAKGDHEHQYEQKLASKKRLSIEVIFD